MQKIKNYLGLVKFSHTIFAMPFAIIGFFVAIRPLLVGYFGNIQQFQPATSDAIPVFVETPIGVKFFLVVLCMIFARSAAMAFNRYLDRNFDAKNPRTAFREIPAGVIRADDALWFTIINSGLFILASFFINKICFFLSPVALFVILFYSYTKRFTALCHLVLGLGLSLAPIGAYLAVTGYFAFLPMLFSMAVFFWVSGFDIIFALQDVDFDKQEGLNSLPVRLGQKQALRLSELLHLLSAVCIISAGVVGNFHILYWIGTCLFCGMLVYQHRLVSPTDLSRVNLAFMTANGVASVLFSIFVILDIFLYA